MRAGRLRFRIALDEPVMTQDDTGDPVPNWVTRAMVWGNIEPLTGRESLATQQVLSDLTTRITLRADMTTERMNATWRLRHRGVIYNITSLADRQLRGREIELLCSSGKNAG